MYFSFSLSSSTNYSFFFVVVIRALNHLFPHFVRAFFALLILPPKCCWQGKITINSNAAVAGVAAVPGPQKCRNVLNVDDAVLCHAMRIRYAHNVFILIVQSGKHTHTHTNTPIHSLKPRWIKCMG